MISTNEIFREIRKRMMDRGVNGDEEFNETMEEVLDEYQDLQIITDDDNVEELRQALKEKWTEFKQIGV